MKRSVTLLILLAGFFFLLLARGVPGGDVWLNLGTEVVGIILTVWLVDRSIRSIQEAQRQRLERLALGQLRIPVRQHLSVLLKMLKAGSLKPFNQHEWSLEKLFEIMPGRLGCLDFSGKAPSMPPKTWFDFTAESFKDLRARIHSVIEKYAAHIDGGTLETLEALSDSQFMNILLWGPAMVKLDEEEGISRPYNILGHDSLLVPIQDHLHALSSIIRALDETTSKPVGIPDVLWRDDVAPELGSSRLVPEDHPLRFEVRSGLPLHPEPK